MTDLHIAPNSPDTGLTPDVGGDSHVVSFADYRQAQAEAKINAMLDADGPPTELDHLRAVLDRIMIEGCEIMQVRTWAHDALDAWGHVDHHG